MQGPSSADWVLPLHVIGERDAARVGTKAATLGMLVRAGLAVPEGLTLSTAVFDRVCDAAGLDDTATVEQVSAAALPADVETLLASVATHFGDATLAVRSSAVEEDASDASYAGQYETVLHVRGPDALREAVRRCWASAFSTQVRCYRRDRRPGPAAIAVLVQRQVDADVAGVAFTADPLNGARSGVLISAVPGLGDALVSGAVSPDEWLVSDATATPVRVSLQALAAAQARSIAALALRVQDVLGGPQDVEWAMAGRRLVVLQARPITALPQQPTLDLPPGTWVKEIGRHPEPLTALGASLTGPLVARGLTAMSAAIGGLIERFEARSVGGEPYMRVVPVGRHDGPPPPWWVLAMLSRVVPPLRRRMRAAERATDPQALAALLERWDTEWRPHLQRELVRLRAVDLTELDDSGLAEHLDAIRLVIDDAMDVHFRLIPPYLVPVHGLITMCSRLLGWPEGQSLSLLAGRSQATLDPSRRLAELAAAIHRNPVALAAVEQSGANLADQPRGTDLLERLSGADPHLGAELADWRDRYAYRNVNDDPGSPVLAELPGLLANLLGDAVAGSADGARQAADAAAERARAELVGRRKRDRDAFELALARALRAYPVREDVAFWTGSVFGGCVRQVALEAGRRLVARGLLDRTDDAVHLPVDTLRAALTDEAGGTNVREVARRGRAEREWTRQQPGPPYHGPQPHLFPDIRGLPGPGRRVNAAMIWMQRSPAALPPPGGGAVLVRGVAASSGRYTGPVRIVRGATDFERLRSGDVLVCPTTDPAWTVLFGIAGALVTDGGSVLSHAAIVARECAIAAVVACGDATRTLRDGQLVTVDGVTGEVLGGR